jgi:nucleotide-binding universal stress UspA family protein
MTYKQEIETSIDTRCQSTGSVKRNRFPVTIERILVPTDLTAASERAIEYGFVLAQRFGAHLTLLHVPGAVRSEPELSKRRLRYV